MTVLARLFTAHGRRALASALQRAGAGSGGGLASPIEKFFQDNRVVAALVARGEKQGQPFGLVCKLIELPQCFFALGLREFLEISLAESLPLGWPCVIPAAQF